MQLQTYHVTCIIGYLSNYKYMPLRFFTEANDDNRIRDSFAHPTL